MSSSRTLRAPRGPSRGGIAKSRSTTPRIDRDGDLDMGSSVGGGRGRGSGRGLRGHTTRSSVAAQPVTATRPRPSARNGVAPERLHQALLNGDKLQARITSAKRGEGLKDIKVTGFRDSKAASNQDGGLKTFISWLERKASGHGDPVRITKVCLTPTSTVSHQDLRNDFDLSDIRASLANLFRQHSRSSIFPVECVG